MIQLLTLANRRLSPDDLTNMIKWSNMYFSATPRILVNGTLEPGTHFEGFMVLFRDYLKPRERKRYDRDYPAVQVAPPL